MKKVLLFSWEYPPKLGGAGSIAHAIVQNLKNLYDVTLATQESEFLDNEGIKIIGLHNYSNKWMNVLNAIIQLKRIDLNPYDVIIINDIFASIVASLSFSKKTRQKAIIYLHGSEPESFFRDISIMKRIVNMKKYYNRLIKDSSHIIAVSNFMKDKFIKLCKVQSLEGKIKVIHNGINEQEFYYCNRNIRQKLNISKNDKVLLTVSRVTKKKGFDRMHKIFKNISNDDKNWYWLIVGDGDYLEKLKIKCKQDGLHEKIRFIGSISRSDLLYYYSDADLFWLLSDYEEALGLVYLEANLCSIPVLANNLGGPQEVICEGVNGYLIDSDKKAIRIIQEKKFIDLDKMSIRNIALSFSANEMNKKVVDIIDKI